MGGDFSFMGIIKYHYRQWRRFPHKGSDKGRRRSGVFLSWQMGETKSKTTRVDKGVISAGRSER